MFYVLALVIYMTIISLNDHNHRNDHDEQPQCLILTCEQHPTLIHESIVAGEHQDLAEVSPSFSTAPPLRLYRSLAVSEYKCLDTKIWWSWSSSICLCLVVLMRWTASHQTELNAASEQLQRCGWRKASLHWAHKTWPTTSYEQCILESWPFKHPEHPS